MLRESFFVGRKDLQYMLRARETLMWTFVMPIVFFFFIGSATSSGYRRGPTQETLALWAAGDAGFLADQLAHRLEERDYTIVRPQSEAEFAKQGRRLVLPAGFTDSVLARHPVKLRFAGPSGGAGFDYDRLRVSRAMYTVLADLVVTQRAGEPSSPESFARLNTMPRALRLETSKAGKRLEILSSFDQAVPGCMVMFTLMIMTTSGAILLFIERRQGLLRRLAYTPIARLSVVLGKWGGKMGLGLVQIGFAMLVGTVLFKVHWGPEIGVIAVLMIIYAALMASIGLVLGSLVRSEGQAIAIGVVTSNIMAALGGCWWPIEVAPKWMQKIQPFLPTGWAMDALHKLMFFGEGLAAVVPHLVGMTLAAAVLLLVAARVFRFE
jgi:ABC-type multidrug transport system permease subunit